LPLADIGAKEAHIMPQARVRFLLRLALAVHDCTSMIADA
jgi:hypothetical protein